MSQPPRTLLEKFDIALEDTKAQIEALLEDGVLEISFMGWRAWTSRPVLLGVLGGRPVLIQNAAATLSQLNDNESIIEEVRPIVDRLLGEFPIAKQFFAIDWDTLPVPTALRLLHSLRDMVAILQRVI